MAARPKISCSTARTGREAKIVLGAAIEARGVEQMVGCAAGKLGAGFEVEAHADDGLPARAR